MALPIEHDSPPVPVVAPTAEQLFAEYAPRVFRLAKWLLDNEADAEDVTGQVFLQVLRKLPSFRGDSSLGTWLNRVAVREALAFRERRAVRRHHEIHDLDQEFTPHGGHVQPVRPWRNCDPVVEAIDHETHEVIERAIAGLPEIYRDVYVLADVEELANAEIARLLGLSLAAVKSRLHRARLLMRKALGPYFEESAA